MKNVFFRIILFEHGFSYEFTDVEEKKWSFDLSAYDEVQQKVSALNPDVVIGQLPKFVLKLLKEGNV